MRLQKILLTSLVVCVFFIQSSLATLDLELTQGMTAALPIAIEPFTGSAVQVPGNEALPQVIRNDLQNSGQFRVLGPDNARQASSAVDYNYWRKQGINDVVIGAIQPVGGGQYRVTFSLINIFGN